VVNRNKAARKKRAKVVAADIATVRSSSWEASGARDNGGRRTGRASTIDCGRAKSRSSACRDKRTWTD
jgi:hypothetical protein